MSGTYKADHADEALTSLVDAGNGRLYLVVRFRIAGWKTIVFERTQGQVAWISRRELDQSMDPEAAVTGLLLGPKPLPHPLESIKRELELTRKQVWGLLKQNSLLKKQPKKAGGKRGKLER